MLFVGAVALFFLSGCKSFVNLNPCIVRSISGSGRLKVYNQKFEKVESYIRRQTLRDVLPPDDLAVAVAAIREDRALREALRPRYDDVTKRIEDQLRTESRSIGDLMGEKAEAQLLTALEDVAGDADATRSFLRTPAVENVIGNVLYEGIYEFIQTVDLLGNIINKLPLIGPMRQQVMASFKKEIDRTLGKQVKSFLVSYSRLATEQMASMVLSEENAKGFASARRKLGEELLQRPLSSLVPSARACQEARDGAWAIAESPLPLSDEVIALCSKLVAAESQPSQTPPRVARVFLVFSLRET
mmetsp:Transcript_73025/g.142880  ORF Transcript_73025/g.142880 Transcript_73025/m.142880 type:complete len:301 (+) Transcript_73025:133-1035(+)